MGALNEDGTTANVPRLCIFAHCNTPTPSNPHSQHPPLPVYLNILLRRRSLAAACLPPREVIALHNVVPFTSLRTCSNSLIIIKQELIHFLPGKAGAQTASGLGGESGGFCF